MKDSSELPCTSGQLTDGPNGSKFARICAGAFLMGSTDSEAGHLDHEGPQQQVTISKSFEMQTTEVTQSQWLAVMGSNPSFFQDTGNCHDFRAVGSISMCPNNPVESVSWDDAQVFIAKLNSTDDGNVYRLPTEAEWEYAARAGATGPYAENLHALDEQAWSNKNSGGMTHPVAKKGVNPWGLFDMYGNVREWIGDKYGSYSASSFIDPMGPGSGFYRVIRGCSWYGDPRHCRPARRDYGLANEQNYSDLGLRLVRTKR